MASISGGANQAAASVAELAKELQDLGNVYDNIAKFADDTIWEKFNNNLKKNMVTLGPLTGMLTSFGDVITATNKKEEKQLMAKQKAAAWAAREQKHIDFLRKNGLSNLELAKKQAKVNKVRDMLNHPDKWDKHEKHLKIQNTLMGVGLVSLKLAAVGYAVLQAAIVGVVSWQNKLQGALSKVARTLGTTTETVVGIRDAAKGSLLDPGGLGDLGYGLEEINQQLTDFAGKMEWMNAVSSQQAAGLIKLGHGLGMAAGEVSELTRDIVVMGGSVKDTEDFMTDMMSSAKIAGVTAKTMAKQFQGAGKALFEITGPKARQRLLESAGFFAKMGMSLDKMKGFIDMSDNFDQAAGSMAKLNTAFGTHINALEVFAEQDADKRAAMVMKQMQMQGVNLNMSRQEKKLMADSLGIEMSQVNAMLKATSAGVDFNKALKEQNELQDKRANMSAEFEETLWKAKESFFSLAQIAGRFWEIMSRVLEPLFAGFKYTLGMNKNVSFLTAALEKVTAITDVWAKQLSGTAGLWSVGDKLFTIGQAFGVIFDEIIGFFSGEGFLAFLSGVIDLMAFVADVIKVILPPIMFVAKLIMGVIGVVAKIISAVMPFVIIIGTILTTIATVAAVVMGIINPISIAVGFIVGLFLALWYTISKIWDGIKKAASWFGWTSDDEGSAKDAAVKQQVIDVRKGTDHSGDAKSISVPETMPGTPGRAVGGPVTSMSPYVVGERGPELFVPSSSGHITPNSVVNNTTQSGGNANITVQVLLDGEVIQERMYKKNLRSIT